MASVSSLLRSATARKAAIQTQNNRVIDTEWDLSAKTSDDLATYTDHYNKAMDTASASDQITYQSKLITATRSFRTAETQRASINVLEGRMDNESKQNLLIGLYNGAVDNGDLAGAQSLNLQIDNLQNTIIQEKTAALNTAQQMADAGYTSVKSFVSDVEAGDAPIMGGVSLNYMNELFRQVGPQGMDAYLHVLGGRLGIPEPSFIDVANYYAEQTLSNLQVAASNLTGADAAKVQNDIAGYLNGTKKFDIPGLTGDNGITYDDLVRAKESQINGSSPIIASQNAADGRPGFIKAPLQNWTVAKDANGNDVITANYEQPELGQGVGSNADSSLISTNDTGMQEVRATVNGVLDKTTKYFMNSQGDVKDIYGRGVKLGNATFTPVHLNAADALQARGFRVNSDGTVDLPNDQSVPPELQGLKAVKYNVDENGNIQFAFETKNVDGSLARNLFTYDPNGTTPGMGERSGVFRSAGQDAVVAKQDNLIFNRDFKGTTSQASRIGDVLQTSDKAREAIQVKAAQDLAVANKAAQVAASASSQNIVQGSGNLNLDNYHPSASNPLQVKNPAPVLRPLVVTAPAPTAPLQVKNTPANANVGLPIYQPVITQGLGVKIQQPSSVPASQILSNKISY